MIERPAPIGGPNPAVYEAAEKIARALGDKAREIGDQSWSIQSALRSIRLAPTSQAKERATENLEQQISKYHNLI